MMTAEDLRYAILQIAMQGKLVKQNISEGSGHIEYAKMRKHRQQLLKEKKIKKEKELLEISEDELAFDIPKNWKFVRLGEVGSWSAGATPSRSHLEYYDGDIPWLKTGDLNDGYITEVPEFITEAGVEHSSVRLNPVGSVLMAMYGATIGKLGILEIEATTNQACCACICYDGMYNKYLFYYLLSQRKNYIAMGAGGAQPNISKDKIVNSIIALPPLEEQKRIVAKIEELMPLVEQYAKASTRLNTLNASFPDQMKKSILQQAVMGKLVPQDPNDEPASVLLKKIAEEKQKLIKDGKIPKEKKLAQIEEEEKEFELPDGWEYVRVQDIASYITDYVANGSFKTLKEHTTTYTEPNYAIYVRTMDLSANFEGRCSYIDKESYDFLQKSKLYGGELILPNIGASIGKAFIMPDLGMPMSLAPNSIMIKFIEPVMNRFFAYVMQSPYGAKMLANTKGGTATPKFSKTELREMVIMLPPLAEIKRIVNKADKMMQMVDLLR